MKNDFENILNTANKPKLTLSEKEKVRSAIFSQIKNGSDAAPNSMSNYSWFLFLSRHTTAVFLVLIMFIGGGASVVAQKALPGEILYGVKTGLNENVGGWFIKNMKDEAEWELKLAERRLEEAELLSREDKLTEERKTVLKKKFDEHARKVEKLLPSGVATEAFSADSSELFSAQLPESEQMSIRSLETGLAALPEDNNDGEIQKPTINEKNLESNEENLESHKKEITRRVEELREIIKSGKLGREKSIQIRFKILKVREIIANLEGELVTEEMINGAKNLIEEAEILAEVR